MSERCARETRTRARIYTRPGPRRARARACAAQDEKADLLLPASLRAAGRDAVPGMRRAELAVTIVALNLERQHEKLN